MSFFLLIHEGASKNPPLPAHAFMQSVHPQRKPPGLRIAIKNNCMLCHRIGSLLVGPSYKEVAGKYRETPNALSLLMDKVKNGGQGVWGNVAMPAQSQASEREIKAVVSWVLSLHPEDPEYGEAKVVAKEPAEVVSEPAVSQIILQAEAAPEFELAKKNVCTACHKITGQLVGPGYMEISKKYKDQAEAFSVLKAKVRKGGQGVWGNIPMAPQTNIPEEELDKIIRWVLELEKEKQKE